MKTGLKFLFFQTILRHGGHGGHGDKTHILDVLKNTTAPVSCDFLPFLASIHAKYSL